MLIVFSSSMSTRINDTLSDNQMKWRSVVDKYIRIPQQH